MPENVSENYSSLREAVNRILGQPPGGTAGTQGQSGFDLAPKPSYSSDIGNIATDATITNTPFDPFAEQNAALAATKAENDRLAAATAAAAAPVAAAAAEPVYDLYNQTRYSYGTSQKPVLEVGSAGGKYVPVSTTNANDAQVRAQLERTLANQKANPSPYLVPATQTIESYLNPSPVAGAISRLNVKPVKAPVNPGPRAPWQASQQYWKDLEAYTQAGGK